MKRGELETAMDAFGIAISSTVQRHFEGLCTVRRSVGQRRHSRDDV